MIKPRQPQGREVIDFAIGPRTRASPTRCFGIMHDPRISSLGYLICSVGKSVVQLDSLLISFSMLQVIQGNTVTIGARNGKAKMLGN